LQRPGSGHLAAPAGQIAGNVAHICFGTQDFETDDRLEHDWFRLFDRVEEGLAPRSDERDFLRVHWMMFAVIDDDAHVLERKSRDRSRDEHLLDAFLHGRNELIGNRSALHFILELKAGAARKRFDTQVDLAELTGATCLLLVAMMALGLTHDRFTVRDPRRPSFDLELELARHALEDRAQMQFA